MNSPSEPKENLDPSADFLYVHELHKDYAYEG